MSRVRKPERPRSLSPLESHRLSNRFFEKLTGAFSRMLQAFQKSNEKPVAQETTTPTPPDINSSPVKPQTSADTKTTVASVLPDHPRRLWNIGLDFGTAYTKCVVRNLATQEAFFSSTDGKRLLASDRRVLWRRFCEDT